MKRHLNTLFITTEDACLAKEGDAVVVKVDQEIRLRVPLNNIGAIVCFGRVLLTQPAIAKCAAEQISIALLTPNGRFLARITGPTSGNVLLRREQYRRADCPAGSADIARNLIAGKIANTRAVLLRHLRDYATSPSAPEVEAAARCLSQGLDALQNARDLDQLRGLEGEAANAYFDVFGSLIRTPPGEFDFSTRTRRPPLDNVNAMLSFLYAMMAHDAQSACEAVGLDPGVGFLHRDRPGRPGLALDLMEELRAFLGDRLALSLINRRQVRPEGFTRTETGAVTMSDETRRTVLTAYQKRKQ